MHKTEAKIDLYISKSAEFAKPILFHLRDIIQEACLDAEEGIKWGFPRFLYQGSIVCSMDSFQQNCAFGFWLSSKMEDILQWLHLGENKGAMGNLGQIKSLDDIPKEDIFEQYILQAMNLI